MMVTKEIPSKFSRVFFLGVLLVLSACGPSLPSTVPMPRLKPAVQPSSEIKDAPYDIYLYVEQLRDARADTAVAELDGRKIAAAGDVAPSVMKGLQGALRKKGFKFSDTAPVILSGEIRKWFADVQGGMPSKVKTEAELHIQVLDPANKRIYSGMYTGYASMQGPSMSAKKVSQALGMAMSEAISQVLADQQLIRLLSSF